MNKSPQEGGCWYCHTEDENLVFSLEFDTFVHVKCIQAAIEADPTDREARFFKKESFPKDNGI